MTNDVEITLEANPASADAARFADYKAAGVNRVSLGVQALNDADLKLLGRLHNAQEARAALTMAMGLFDRVSLDLIYARPVRPMRHGAAELKQALSFGTDHLSLYQLTIEPQTPFALLHKNGKLHIPDDDLAADLYETTQEMTEAADRPAYEISNHARPGAESRHNLIYWRYGDYAGVGPGAHGRLMLNGARMATAIRQTAGALADMAWKNRATPSPICLQVTDGDAAREHLLMNLRLAEGIDLAAYEMRWGVRPDAAKIADAGGAGLAVAGRRYPARHAARTAGAQCRDREFVELRTGILERGRRGADDIDAVRRHFQHRQPALRRAVRLKAENAIDPGKAVGVHQRRLGEAMIGGPRRQQRHQRHCIIGQGGKLRRRRAIGVLVFGVETAVGIRFGGGEPAAAQDFARAQPRDRTKARCPAISLWPDPCR